MIRCTRILISTHNEYGTGMAHFSTNVHFGNHTDCIVAVVQSEEPCSVGSLFRCGRGWDYCYVFFHGISMRTTLGSLSFARRFLFTDIGNFMLARVWNSKHSQPVIAIVLGTGCHEQLCLSSSLCST